MTALNKILAILFQACLAVLFFFFFPFFFFSFWLFIFLFSLLFFFLLLFFTKLRVTTKHIIFNDIFRGFIIFSTCDPDLFGFFLLCTNEIVRLADPERVCGCVVRHLASAFSLKDNMYNGVAPSERMSCWNTSNLHIYKYIYIYDAYETVCLETCEEN